MGANSTRSGAVLAHSVEGLPATTAVLDEGIRLGWHTGAQVSAVLADGARVDLSVGDAEPGVAMTTDTLLPWFCAAKPLLAVAVGHLVDEGRVRFDDPVASYVPGFEAHGKGEVTIAQVLTHTAGFRNDPAARHLGQPWPEIVAAIVDAPLEPGWAPGLQASYQLHSSWYLLGAIVMAVTGLPLSQALREQVLEPLALGATSIGMSAAEYVEKGPLIAPVHDVTAAIETFPVDLHGAGPCCSCDDFAPRGPASDLATFYHAMLDDGRVAGVISPAVRRTLVTRARVGQIDNLFGVAVDVGLGFELESRRHGTRSQRFGRLSSDDTFGQFGAFSAGGFGDPERGFSGAFTVNGFAGPLKNRVRSQAILTALYRDVGFDRS